MKRTLVLLYVGLLLWCTVAVVWRRFGMQLVPTQVSAPLVYATIVLNCVIGAVLLKRFVFRNFAV